MSLLTHELRGENVSRAWVNVIRAVDAMPGDQAFQVTVRIDRPAEEVAGIRAAVDQLLGTLRLAPVDEVRNTVFPASLALKYPEPADLTARYRNYTYPRLKRLERENAKGTYFNRFADYPASAGAIDQLVNVAEKLRASKAGTRVKSMYEVDMAEGLDMAVYRHTKDHKKRMAFPCLSFCSFQLDGHRVHLVAHYRSQYLVQRAYGNYLGLGQLLQYVATAAGFDTGQLLVVAGHARIDKSVSAVRMALESVEERA